MTTANNGAINGSYINSTGVMQVAGGGTGLSAVGTSGYVLASNGSANVYVSAVGYSGYSGYSGTNGSNGTSGFSGYSGTNGSNGTSGFSGYSGTNGSNGATGTSGFSGYSGTNGSAGATGTSGYSGYSGATGAGASTSFNAVGSYAYVAMACAGDDPYSNRTYSVGTGNRQIQSCNFYSDIGAFSNISVANNLSGTWRWMGGQNTAGNNTFGASLAIRIA